MTVLQIEETSSAQIQLRTYNEASAMIKRPTYSPPAGTAWAVVGCVLADAATPADVDSTLVPAIEALSEVTSVADPRIWGQTPATLEINPEAPADPTHEIKIHCNANLSCQIGTAGDKYSYSERRSETQKPPLGKKFIILNIVVPAKLDATSKSALEAAITGITGIMVCEHLIDGQVPDDASTVQLTIETRMRIDPIPEE